MITYLAIKRIYNHHRLLQPLDQWRIGVRQPIP